MPSHATREAIVQADVGVTRYEPSRLLKPGEDVVEPVAQRRPRWWMWRSFLTVLLLIAATDLAVSLVVDRLSGLGSVTRAVLDVVGVVAITAPLLWLIVVRPLWAGLADRNRRVARSEEDLREQAESIALIGRIQRALEMAVDEPDVMAVAQHTIDTALPGRSAEILMADSSQAHLVVDMATPDGGPGCPVSKPADCPAVRVGHQLTFPSRSAIDACPRLRDRDGGPRSAVCVPMSVLGRAAGVLHVASPGDRSIDEEEVALARELGAAVGRRLSLIRALTNSQRQASSDPLTGLMNRRALEDRVTVMDRGGRPYALITLDLDHFKSINDTHGHAAGDQALRLFARAMKEMVRASDLAARYGGEEFLIVLPDANLDAAAALAERLRAHLLELLSAGSVPGFTVSAGVADTTVAAHFEGILAAADAGLFRAKANGRDRVELATAA